MSPVHNVQKPAEFPTAEHRASHLLALKREADGYKAKAKGCESRGDDSGAELYKGRAQQVADELKRIGDSATPQRGATRA